MTGDDRPWLDILTRKHECGPSLSPFAAVEVLVGGRPATLRLPDRFGDLGLLEVKAVIGEGPLISVIATHPGDEEVEGPFTILMVARRSGDGMFVVHVWHELYEWALKYLGLAGGGAGDEGETRA